MYHIELLAKGVSFWLTHVNIQWMTRGILPWCIWTAMIGSLIAWCNLSFLNAKRALWGKSIEFNRFSPRNRKQRIFLWVKWIALFEVLIVSFFGPNLTTAPTTVPAGSTQVIFDFDGSNSVGSQENRAFFAAMTGERDPGLQYQWGTGLDTAKAYVRQDLLTQLGKNEAGLVTIVGAGFTTWNLTRDLAENGALHYMLDNWVVLGGAQGGGCDYTSGLRADLDEFHRASASDADIGDTAAKERFIVLFSDGGFTGDEKELDAVLDQLNEEKIHLLMVEIGPPKPTTVKKYDLETGIVTKESYEGTTFAEPVVAEPGKGEVYPGYPVQGRMRSGEKIFLHMLARVKSSDLIYAPPGTMHVNYSFPQKMGGLSALAGQSNLRPFFYLIAAFIFIGIAIGGGGILRWRLIVAPIRPILRAVASIPGLITRGRFQRITGSKGTGRTSN